MVRVKVGTWNAPPRLGPHNDGLRWFDRQGADIVVCQEQSDANNWAPKGWRRYRPKKAQSNTIYSRIATTKAPKKKRGLVRLSSPGFSSLRYLVWQHFRTRQGNKPIRVGSVHLPAFYSKPSRKKEYDKQAPKVAAWMRGGKNRVIGGDFNGSKGGARMKPINADVILSDAVRTGPQGQKIDYVGVPRRGGAWRIVKTERGPKFGSDHAPVLVTLERVPR